MASIEPVKPPQLTVSDDARTKCLDAFRILGIETCAEWARNRIRTDHTLLSALKSCMESADFEAHMLEGVGSEQQVSLAHAFRLGACSAYFALAQNKQPTVPKISRNSYLSAVQDETMPLTVRSELSVDCDSNLRTVMSTAERDIGRREAGLPELAQRTFRMSAGLVVILMDTELREAA